MIKSPIALRQPVAFAQVGRRPWHWLGMLLPLVANRVVLFLAAAVAVLVLPVKSDSAGVWPGGPMSLWPAVLSRWDGRWYFSISHDGYQYLPGQESNVVFTPLLPVLMRIGGGLLGRLDPDALLGVGVVVSNVALVAALLLLWRLVDEHWGRAVATRTVICLIVFPTSFFFSATYPEALFLALALGAFAAADRGRWWLVGILGGLAATARIYGVLLTLPLAWMYLSQYHRRIEANALWLVLIPAGLLSWLGYLFVLTGDPLVVQHAEVAWGRAATAPWESARLYWASPHTPGSVVHFFIDSLSAVLVGVLVVVSWCRLRRAHLAVYTLLFYLPIAASGLFTSAPRYALELFPVFIVLGQLTAHRLVFACYLTIASVLSLVAVVSFAIGNFVA